MLKRNHIHWVLVSLIAFGVGCAGTPPKIHSKNGVEYGRPDGVFRHKWWNYYQRALSYMEGEFYPDARLDLEKAIEKRSADQRRARTYGLHFLDYFPHRELGIIYYLTGDYQSAKKELERSLAQAPSAKAQFYIDKIRRLILETGHQIRSAPLITLNMTQKEFWTKDDAVIISGAVADAQFVASLTVSGVPYFLPGSSERVDFSKSYRLRQGKHTIEIVAENLIGGMAVEKVVVHVDRQGPVITIAPEASGIGTINKLSGYLLDESGEMALSVDGAPVDIPPGEDVYFSVPVSAGKQSVKILATDRLGNETRAEIEMERLQVSQRYELVAENDFAAEISDAGPLLALSPKRQDNQNPSVKLIGWAQNQTVYIEKVFIEGDVRDESDIVEITINDVPVLRRKGPIVFFNHLLDLQEGKNRVILSAMDVHGNKSVKEISINREIPNVFQIGSRFSMTLFPFNQKGIPTGLGDMYENLFLARLMDQNRFRLVEREMIAAVLREQKLSQTKLIDESTAIEMGRMVAARATLVGDFIETRLGIEVVARLIDNETSEILAIKDVYDEIKDRAAIMDLAEGLAIKIHREFPLLDGTVVENKIGGIYTDMGKGKIKPQRRLIIYREGEPIRQPSTGRILGADTQILGYARVTQVMDNMSKAELVGNLTSADITIRDKVITE